MGEPDIIPDKAKIDQMQRSETDSTRLSSIPFDSSDIRELPQIQETILQPIKEDVEENRRRQVRQRNDARDKYRIQDLEKQVVEQKQKIQSLLKSQDEGMQYALTSLNVDAFVNGPDTLEHLDNELFLTKQKIRNNDNDFCRECMQREKEMEVEIKRLQALVGPQHTTQNKWSDARSTVQRKTRIVQLLEEWKNKNLQVQVGMKRLEQIRDVIKATV